MIQFKFRWEKIDKAIIFLALSINNFSNNPKPVVFHSTRIWLGLLELGYSEDIVVWGLLHDLIEDSDVKIENIKEKFWNEVAWIVLSNTFNSKLPKNEQYIDCYKRCNEFSKNAVIVKAMDIYDNSLYYSLWENIDNFLFVMKKMKYFIEISLSNLKNEETLLNLLIQRYEFLLNKEFKDDRIKEHLWDYILNSEIEKLFR